MFQQHDGQGPAVTCLSAASTRAAAQHEGMTDLHVCNCWIAPRMQGCIQALGHATAAQEGQQRVNASWFQRHCTPLKATLGKLLGDLLNEEGYELSGVGCRDITPSQDADGALDPAQSRVDCSHGVQMRRPEHASCLNTWMPFQFHAICSSRAASQTRKKSKGL